MFVQPMLFEGLEGGTVSICNVCMYICAFFLNFVVLVCLRETALKTNFHLFNIWQMLNKLKVKKGKKDRINT